MKQRLLVALLPIFLAALQSCTKDREIAPPVEFENSSIWVLSEGAMSSNNSSLTTYNLSSGQTNTIAIGETGNDLQQYGSKVYCVVTGVQGQQASFVKVFDAQTGNKIKDISFNGDKEGYLPRNIVFDNGKAYVSCYDGAIRRIDTISLTVDNEIKGMGALEGMCINNNKLYVANSNHYAYPNASIKDAVSVISLSNFSKSKDISGISNPVAVVNIGNRVLVQGMSIWGGAAASLSVIDATSDIKLSSNATEVTALSANGTTAYAITDPYGKYALKTLSADGTVTGDFTPTFAVVSPYGLSVDAVSGNAVITDAGDYSSNGTAHLIDKSGKILKSFEAGVSPKRAAFIYTIKK